MSDTSAPPVDRDLPKDGFIAGQLAQNLPAPLIKAQDHSSHLSPDLSESLTQSASTVSKEYQIEENIENTISAETEFEMTVFPETSTMDDENKANGNVADKDTETGILQGSPNRAIYDFKHQDTDVEDSPRLERKCIRNLAKNQFNPINEKEDSESTETVNKTMECSTINLNLANIRRRGRTSWPRQHDPSEEYDSEALQELIDSSILDPDWLKGGSDGLDNGSLEGASDEPAALETMDTGSEEHIQTSKDAIGRTRFDSSIHQLVNGAEVLVQATPLPSPIVSPRAPLLGLGGRSHASAKGLAPLHFGVSSESASKQMRIRSWLATQRPAPALLDSCDASGEMTTGESEGDTSDSADLTHTTQIPRELSQSAVSTPVNDRCGLTPFGSEPSKVCRAILLHYQD